MRPLAGVQVAPADTAQTFDGYARPGGRGVGTRNFIIVLATTARSTAVAEALARRFEDAPARHPGIDGVVAVTHTEGGGRTRPNNLDFVLRTLAGFVVHPNAAAAMSATTALGGRPGASHLDSAKYASGAMTIAVMSVSSATIVQMRRETSFRSDVRACAPTITPIHPNPSTANGLA